MLSINDLHIKFHTRKNEAVAGISFSVNDGEILGIVGESGSGKSVTAMSIAGILPRKQCSYSGQIMLDGVELLHAKRNILRTVQGKKIGFVFQEPQTSMNPLMKVGKQIEEVLKLHTNMSPSERKQAAIDALLQVELMDAESVYKKYPFELSGGMVQRAMIASAIIIKPSLLILDEPTTALDVTTQSQIISLLKKLNKESGITMIFISHNLNVVRKFCKRIIVMQHGKIVEENDVEKIFEVPQHDYTKLLLKSIPSNNWRNKNLELN